MGISSSGSPKTAHFVKKFEPKVEARESLWALFADHLWHYQQMVRLPLILSRDRWSQARGLYF